MAKMCHLQLFYQEAISSDMALFLFEIYYYLFCNINLGNSFLFFIGYHLASGLMGEYLRARAKTRSHLLC